MSGRPAKLWPPGTRIESSRLVPPTGDSATMTYVLGLDSSTTATKALIVDAAGQVVATGTAEYSYETPQALWAEQDPNLWWTGTIEAVRRCLESAGVGGESIAAIGVTGQMHGLALVGADDQPVRPAILWNDQRTAAECDEMRRRVGKDRLIAISGNDALTGFTASKLLWVRSHEPDAYGAARRMLLPKDYVRLRLTGEYATDRAGGSGTQLFDLAERDWSPELLETLEIDDALLPRTFEGPEVTGLITAEAAALIGLVAGTPVVAGGGDQAANAVGAGALDPGEMALSLGTSGVVFAATAAPVVEPQGRVHAFCHAVPDRWHMMGVMLSAAGSMRWLRDTVAPGSSFEELSAEAARVPPGSDGLLFLPYLSGERTPHPDPLARGAFVGLTVRHERAHLVRAVMEGVAYGLRDGYELMVAAGAPRATLVRGSGGGTKSSLWRQIVADVLGVELALAASSEGAAFGAALLATAAAGWTSEPSDLAAEWVHVTDAASPGVADYEAGYSIFRRQYPLLRKTFADLSGV